VRQKLRLTLQVIMLFVFAMLMFLGKAQIWMGNPFIINFDYLMGSILLWLDMSYEHINKTYQMAISET